MCFSGGPPALPPPPIVLPIEKLVAETAKDIKPNTSKKSKRAKRDKFNLRRPTVASTTIGGINAKIPSKALKIGTN